MRIWLEKLQFKMLVVFLLIFVVDTKIILRYDFVAPLISQTHLFSEKILKHNSVLSISFD